MNTILEHRNYVASQIEKSFGEEIDIEKAHNVGDVHPNGKWVWTEYAPGKFDWRSKKNGGSGSHRDKKDTSDEKERGIITLPHSPAQEEAAYAAAASGFRRDYEASPVELKRRNAKITTKIVSECEKVDKEFDDEFRKEHPRCSPSKWFNGVYIGHVFGPFTPKENEFKCIIKTRMYKLEDAKNLISRLSLQKIAKKYGFTDVKIQFDGSVGDYKEAYVIFLKNKSAEHSK